MSALAVAAVAVEPAVARCMRFWTNREERVLQAHYPTGGAEACAPLLPRRSLGAIYQHAVQLGLRAPATGDFRRQRWFTNPVIDEMIRRTYHAAPSNNAVNELAARAGRPRWWVSKRAVRLGLVGPRFKQPEWNAAELEILGEHAHKDPAVICRRLKAAGYARSETAIVVKRKRLALDIRDPNRCTATQLAALMGVDTKTVTGWIVKGWLEAKRRGTARVASQGGDMWWIKRRAVRAFIADNAAAVDLRKVDKFWFIDLLAGPV